MYIYINIYIHTYIHTYIYIHTCMCVWNIYIYVCVCECHTSRNIHVSIDNIVTYLRMERKGLNATISPGQARTPGTRGRQDVLRVPVAGGTMGMGLLANKHLSTMTD